MKTETIQEFLHDLDPSLRSFLQERVDSLVKWDIVRFFSTYPQYADTAACIAAALGREEASVSGALVALVASGVLLQERVAGTTDVYRLTRNALVLRDLDQFMRACDDRLFRQRAIAFVVQRAARGG